MPDIYSIYNPPPSVSFKVEGVSATKQEFAKESDINTIMSRYIKSGSLPITPERQAQYGDFVNVDFRSIQDAVARGVQEFEALPSQIRREFGNDPAAYYEHLSTADAAELQRLGLIPTPDSVDPSSPTPPSDPTKAPSAVPPSPTPPPPAAGAS